MPGPLYRTSSAFRCTALLLLCLLALLAPRSAAAWQPKRDIRRQIERLEEQWRQAQLAGDISTMDKMMSDDYVGITMAGEVVTKSQQLNRTRSRSLVLTQLRPEEIKIKLVGQVAIVTVRAAVQGTREGTQMGGQFRYTRIYQHLPTGAWRITHFEATRMH